MFRDRTFEIRRVMQQAEALRREADRLVAAGKDDEAAVLYERADRFDGLARRMDWTPSATFITRSG